MKNVKRKLGSWVVVCLAILCMGARLQSDNPVMKAQTDPISLKAKQEEIKDGVKGAPSPSMRFYGEKKEFFTKSSVADEGSAIYETAADGEPLEDSMRSFEEEEGIDFWWQEESSQDLGGETGSDAGFEDDVWWADEAAMEETEEEEEEYFTWK